MFSKMKDLIINIIDISTVPNKDNSAIPMLRDVFV